MLVNIPFKRSVLLLIILEQCPQTAIASVQSTQQGPSSITGSLLGRESGGCQTTRTAGEQDKEKPKRVQSLVQAAHEKKKTKWGIFVMIPH